MVVRGKRALRRSSNNLIMMTVRRCFSLGEAPSCRLGKGATCASCMNSLRKRPSNGLSRRVPIGCRVRGVRPSMGRLRAF